MEPVENPTEVSGLNPTVFERNSARTIIAVVFLILIFCDIATERLLDRSRLLNKMLHSLNTNLAYKVEIWQHRTQNPYYHHDLEPNHDMIEAWGVMQYRLVTNSLGFKDASMRTVPPDTPIKRILFIGDSFTEGLGMPYDKTFVGMIDKRVDHDKFDILNAAVVSYSPKIYYNKVKYLLEEKHLKIDDLYVFIDISDTFNEIEYELFEPQSPQRHTVSELVERMGIFLQHYSFFYNVVRYYYSQAKQVRQNNSLDYITQHREEAPFWTLNEDIYKEWGEKGVRLAEMHMQKLVDLCRARGIAITIAVYPWQNEIYFGNRNSKQLRIWREFSERNNIGFINYYPDFFDAQFPNITRSKVPPQLIVNSFFIPGDIHWNEAGHRLIADKLPIP
jgi:hypothetical protein